jgi:hypothetical protein
VLWYLLSAAVALAAVGLVVVAALGAWRQVKALKAAGERLGEIATAGSEGITAALPQPAGRPAAATAPPRGADAETLAARALRSRAQA